MTGSRMQGRTFWPLTVGLVVAIGFVAPLSAAIAQDSAAMRRVAVKDTGSIPVSARPPAGMCRIWLDDVPVSRQPAPSDCASAVRNRPPKGRVVFGDDYVKRAPVSQRQSLPFVKGFAPTKPESVPKKPAKPDTP